MTHTTTILLIAMAFCAALVAVIATLCRIGEKNRKKELDDIWGG